MSEAGEALGLRGESEYGPPPPPTRWSQPWSTTAVKVLTALGALIVGFSLSAGIGVGRQAAVEQNARRAELVQLVSARQQRASALSKQLEELRAEVARTESAAAAAGAPALNQRLARVEAAAGLTGVRGPGVRVTFSDAEGTCATGRPEDCRIQDADLQLAVNTLWGLGAEAVAVNGERVIATTAIRSAGTTVLVNYQLLSSPYIIEAIGDSSRLLEGFEDSQLAVDFVEFFREIYGLGYGIEAAAELDIPAYGGSVTMENATQLDGGTTP